MEENANYASVVGDTTSMPYLNSLISSYGLATQYYGNTHPSKRNYLMLVTGQVLTNDHGGGRVAGVLISPAFSKKGYQSTTLYQHQSTLRLMLEGLGVDTFPAAASAPSMTEFFSFPSTP